MGKYTLVKANFSHQRFDFEHIGEFGNEAQGQQNSTVRHICFQNVNYCRWLANKLESQSVLVSPKSPIAMFPVSWLSNLLAGRTISFQLYSRDR